MRTLAMARPKAIKMKIGRKNNSCSITEDSIEGQVLIKWSCHRIGRNVSEDNIRLNDISRDGGRSILQLMDCVYDPVPGSTDDSVEKKIGQSLMHISKPSLEHKARKIVKGHSNVLHLLKDVFLDDLKKKLRRNGVELSSEIFSDLLKWINSVLPKDHNVSGFSRDWSGTATHLSALINGLHPDFCKDWKGLLCINKEKDIKDALDIAERHLNVPKLFDENDFVRGNVDEFTMKVYLSLFLTNEQKYEHCRMSSLIDRPYSAQIYTDEGYLRPAGLSALNNDVPGCEYEVIDKDQQKLPEFCGKRTQEKKPDIGRSSDVTHKRHGLLTNDMKPWKSQSVDSKALRDVKFRPSATEHEFWQHLPPDHAKKFQESLRGEIKTGVLKIGNPIGSGRFGEVCQGRLAEENIGYKMVAVKSFHDDCTLKDVCDFLGEAVLMKNLRCPNVAFIHGLVFHNGKPYMMLPISEQNSLKEYLNKHAEKLSDENLLEFLIGIARGMEALAEHLFVHRNLSIESTIITQNADGAMIVKISEFGFTRDVMDNYYSGTMLPLNWRIMAPEILKEPTSTRFTQSTDIFSLGTTGWSLYSDGKIPFQDVDDYKEVIAFWDTHQSLIRPESVPQPVFEVMVSCWRKDPKQRPTFREVLSNLVTIKEQYIASQTYPKHV